MNAMDVLLVISVFLVVTLVIFMMINRFFFKCIHEEFSVRGWNEYREERYTYAKDIIENELLLGFSKNEVKELLGHEFNDMNSMNWSYYLGTCSGLFRIKKKKLVVYFNKRNKVSKVVTKS